MDTDIGIKFAAAVALFELSAIAVAITFTIILADTGVGAVYRPVGVIVPQAVPEHPEELSDHATAVFELPRTTAVNC